MSDRYSSRPSNLGSLRDRLALAARWEGVPFGRLQRHVAVLVVAEFMASLTDTGGFPAILVKGGSALEFRCGVSRSRASRDVDAVTGHDLHVLLQELAVAASRGWQGFTGALTEPEAIDVPELAVKPLRFTVKVKYAGAPFVSVPVEVSPAEAGNADEVEWATSSALELVGLPMATPVPCMTIPWQVGQKLHAVTTKLSDGRPNDRAHDLVDLQILEALAPAESLADIRRACLAVFEVRAQQHWPPQVAVPAHWASIYTAALESVPEMGFAVDVHQAAAQVNAFIRRVDEHRDQQPRT